MESPSSKILAELAKQQAWMPLHKSTAESIALKINGWSGPYHYLFFKSLFAALPDCKNVLILGVYQGRDIAFMSSACGHPLQITGVDKFSDTPCDDWPDKNVKFWEEAGFGAAPSIEKALENLRPILPASHELRLIEADDAVWLTSVVGKWDFIYLDTAHDRATVDRQLAQVKPLCHETTVVGGDDYENLTPQWGVKDAVTAGFREHHVVADTIWFADAGAMR